MIRAYSLQTQILVALPYGAHRLERRSAGEGWLALSDSGFAPGDGAAPVPATGNFLDEDPPGGIVQYRARPYGDGAGEWGYTAWLRGGASEPVGYTFGNYRVPEGTWGDIITPDDLRFSYLWGVDFRASNGASFTDAQIQYFIDAALEEIERKINVTIKKTRVASEPDRRGLARGRDYDAAESQYAFRRERIQRQGMIATRRRPVISVSRLDLVNMRDRVFSLLGRSAVDGAKGKIRFFDRLPRTSDSARGVETAIFPYGAETISRQLFYEIDYVAGFETSDDVPTDLRETIAKQAAVSLLNVIGRGLMSGFSSSSLSMDGVSESFSSTQSATAAFYGADIQQYKDEIRSYVEKNKFKFGHVVMGAL